MVAPNPQPWGEDPRVFIIGKFQRPSLVKFNVPWTNDGIEIFRNQEENNASPNPDFSSLLYKMAE
jgi:hypothetical protein